MADDTEASGVVTRRWTPCYHAHAIRTPTPAGVEVDACPDCGAVGVIHPIESGCSSSFAVSLYYAPTAGRIVDADVDGWDVT